MSQKFYTLITQQGAVLLANATALGTPLKLSKMAVGDANGKATTPNASQTKLIHKVYQAPLNSLTIDEKNPNQIIAELVIPENQGGWFINEIGLYDENDTLVAVGNCPATYKPQLSEGSGRTQIIRMIIVVDNINAVALKIDPSVVLATRQYVDDLITSKMTAHEKSTNHPNATTKSKGFVQLNSAIDSNLENQAATPLAVKKVNDRVNIITDKFVPVSNETRVYSADKRFYTLIRNDGVMGMYSNVKKGFAWQVNHDGWMDGYMSADRVGGLDKFVRDRALPVGIPQPWPKIQLPTGWLECNGSTFDKSKFPKLAVAYPTGILPDLRGEFIRGWDNGRGIDNTRNLLSTQCGSLAIADTDPKGIDLCGLRYIDSSNPNKTEGIGCDKVPVNDYPDNVYAVWRDVSANSQLKNYSSLFGVVRPRNIAFMYIVKAE